VDTPPAVPSPEVVPKARRRTYSAEYKLRILREADACGEAGQIGALLRREGLYSSNLTEWRRLREKGFLAAAGERRRGRKPKPVDPNAKRVAELERELARTREKLRKAETIIEFQKKVHDLLQMQEEGGAR
jgi:transposase-like protein